MVVPNLGHAWLVWDEQWSDLHMFRHQRTSSNTKLSHLFPTVKHTEGHVLVHLLIVLLCLFILLQQVWEERIGFFLPSTILTHLYVFSISISIDIHLSVYHMYHIFNYNSNYCFSINLQIPKKNVNVGAIIALYRKLRYILSHRPSGKSSFGILNILLRTLTAKSLYSGDGIPFLRQSSAKRVEGFLASRHWL